MAKNYAKDVYVHFNFNKNEIKNFLLQNDNYESIPTPTTGSDKGLIYFDTILDRILVWNGECWKIVKYLDDRDFTSRENIYLDDIWMQVELIPDNLTSAQVSDIVEELVWVQTVHVPGTYSFKIPGFADIIEYERFGAFYEEKLVTFGFSVIPGDFSEWRRDGDMITFFKGFEDPDYPGINVGPTQPPKIKYWTYTGAKGSFNFIGGSTNILEFTPMAIPYNKIMVPSNVTEESTVSVTINGVLIYDFEIIDFGGNLLCLDEIELCYTIEDDDIIRVEVTGS